MKYTISLAKMYNPDDIYDQLEKYIDISPYFAGTLEELRGVLRLIKQDTEIVFTDTAEAEVMMSKYMKNLKKLCEVAFRENNKLNIRFEQFVDRYFH